MDSLNSSNYVKFLLDLANFENALRKNKLNLIQSCNNHNNNNNSKCDCQINQNKSII